DYPSSLRRGRDEMRRAAFLVSLLVAFWIGIASARAALDRIEILERQTLADGAAFGSAGPYEKIRGRAWFALDPASPANAAIVDLALAPRDGAGHVVFASDFLMLRPLDPARGNGALLYE